MPSAIDMIVDGVVDGKQTEKLKTVILQTDLNMVGHLNNTTVYIISFAHKAQTCFSPAGDAVDCDAGFSAGE